MNLVAMLFIATLASGCATTHNPYMQMDAQYANQYRSGKISYMEYLAHHERLVNQSMTQTNLENSNKGVLLQKPNVAWPPEPEIVK